MFFMKRLKLQKLKFLKTNLIQFHIYFLLLKTEIHSEYNFMLTKIIYNYFKFVIL